MRYGIWLPLLVAAALLGAVSGAVAAPAGEGVVFDQAGWR